MNKQKVNNSSETTWHCPLINALISEGRCLDLNYERLGYIKVGAVEKMKKESGKTEQEINFICEHCINMPL